MTPEELDQFRKRFLATFGSLDQRALSARSRAIVGTDYLPATPQGQLAASALDKLRTGADPGPSPAEFAALEYMIRAMRPAPLIHDGVIDGLTDPDFLAAFHDWPGFLNSFPQWASGIGCLMKITGSQQPQGEGTGFLVAKNVLLTNAHVLDALSNGVRALEKGQAIVRFRCEAGSFNPELSYDVVGALAVHPTQDACLLQLGGDYSGAILTLATSTPAVQAEVAAIGFPYPDTRNPAFVTTTFGNQLGFKRASPGFITGGQPATNTLFHDCSTLGGNSGSPLISMTDGIVVGMHKGGGFMWKNLAIDAIALQSFVQGALHV